MAKLIIYRGDTLDREIELGERTARIGRGDQNEIVLPDPAKSVSRFHAELRIEQGRYTIVDLNSQNGTWVAGRRVPQAVLEPGVPVVLGTYRIVLRKDDAPAPAESADATLIAVPVPARPAAPPPVTATSATMVGGAAPAPAPPAALAAPPAAPRSEAPPAPKAEPPPPPKVVPPAPRPVSEASPAPKPAPISEPPPAPRPVPKPEPPPAPKPAPKPEPPPTPKPAPAPPAPPPVKPTPVSDAEKGQKKGWPKIVLVGGFAALVIAVLAAGVLLTPLKSRVPGLSGGPAAQPSGGTTPASDAATPAEPSPQPSASPAVPPPVQAPAPAAAPAPSQKTPAGASATSVRPAADAAAPTAPRAGGAAASKTTTPPAPAGGRRGREPVPPPAKPLNLAQTLEEARSAMIKGDYLAAIAGFEAILKVDPKYPNAAELLGVAKGGAKNAAQLAVDSGNKAEMSGDYVTAATQYDRALQFDPESSSAPDAIRRMKARKQSEGEDAFKRARQYDAMGRGKDAVPLYEKALELLPADHTSAAVAKERLAALKGGF